MKPLTRYGIPNIGRVSRILFYTGLGCGLAVLAAWLILSRLGISISGVIRPCAIHAATGYYCPGCGGTRAIYVLLHGTGDDGGMLSGDMFASASAGFASVCYNLASRLVASFLYHPAVLYFLGYYAIYEISHVISLVSLKHLRGLYFCPYVLYFGAVLIIVQCLAKNYLVMRYGFSLELLYAAPSGLMLP